MQFEQLIWVCPVLFLRKTEYQISGSLSETLRENGATHETIMEVSVTCTVKLTTADRVPVKMRSLGHKMLSTSFDHLVHA